jgi:DNA repair exonuclease SbcCD ATPase subunit
MKKLSVSNSSVKVTKLKTRLFNILMFAVFFVMLFMLLKENEGRVAAEERLKDIRYKVDTYANEKENVITNLEGRVNELENKLQESQTQYKQLVAEKDQQVNDLNTQLNDTTQKHQTMLQEKTSQIEEIEQKSNRDTAKFSALLKEKNEEIADLSARLKDSSAKISDLLKKKQELESKNLLIENELGGIKSKLKSLERQHEKLAEVMKEAQINKNTGD